MKFSLTNDFLNSNKIMFHFSKILGEYLAGKRNFYPIAIEIHPTVACNHNCIHCSYTTRNQKHKILAPKVMDQLISSITNMGIQAVYFSGGGEPTFYKNIDVYVKRLNLNGVETAIITNGSYFEESGIFDIANCFNYIAISVPSTNREKYTYITGRDNLSKVLAVPYRIKDIYKERSPVIGARVVVTSRISDDIVAIYKDLIANGFDYALFKIVRDYEDRGIGLTQSKQDALKVLIEQNKNVFDGNITNVFNLFEYQSVPITRCLMNEIGFIANVDSDGCVFPNIVEIGNEDFCIGNLYNNTLEEIWNSEKHQHVKANSIKKSEAELCKNCRCVSYNFIVNNFLDRLPGKYDSFI